MGKVFISYRRMDKDFAHRLAEKLRERIAGTIFIDQDIRSDDYREELDQQVAECNVFVIAVTEHTFSERIFDADDWVRHEIAHALYYDKPIALAVREGCPPPIPEQLPDMLWDLLTKQALWLYATLYDQSVDRLAEHIISISNGGLARKTTTTQEAPAPKSFVGSMQAGDRSFQAGVIEGNVTINELNTQILEAESAINRLKRDREQERQMIQQLQYRSRISTYSSEGLLFQIAIFSIIAGLAGGFNPVIGAVVIAAGVLFLLSTIWIGRAEKNTVNDQVAQAEQRVRQFEVDINDYEGIIDRAKMNMKQAYSETKS